ncbi:hypothetical protein KP509_05G069000 [Ceratopteris richardii]|uniref:CRM domain-containing protein n=1 Tax=Ceratopteris richardii TaxID=49495 RepID=A0A8T2UUE5_CERRI|nr:hypothetical protein KP509_05G069000 [Ceratopteris richardii]KAH7437392.1 hypothetical protein KP509_05G069000 [Ceratopteris richardii]KAH7437393.1 hypothetical protein KP509_05G069000 [Ceratopteris richardii]
MMHIGLRRIAKYTVPISRYGCHHVFQMFEAEQGVCTLLPYHESRALHTFQPASKSWFQCRDLNQLRHTWSPWNASGVFFIIKFAFFGQMQFTSFSTASDKKIIKEEKKKKKKKKSKRGIIKKLKQLRYVTKIKKANMDHEQKLLARMERAKKKIERLEDALQDYELPPLPPPKHDPESLTAEELHYLKRLGYKHKNYMILGVRKVFGGVILNMHLHWKKHQLVKIRCKNFTREQINETGAQLARLSGGIVVDVQKGDTIVMYRGRNYKRPEELTPRNTLSKRKALFKAKFEQSLESTRKNLEAAEKELALYREHKAKEEAGLFSQTPTVGCFSSWSDTEDEQTLQASVQHSGSEDIDVDPALVCESDSVLESSSDTESQSGIRLDSESDSDLDSVKYARSLVLSVSDDSDLDSDFDMNEKSSRSNGCEL